MGITCTDCVRCFGLYRNLAPVWGQEIARHDTTSLRLRRPPSPPLNKPYDGTAPPHAAPALHGALPALTHEANGDGGTADTQAPALFDAYAALPLGALEKYQGAAGHYSAAGSSALWRDLREADVNGDLVGVHPHQGSTTSAPPCCDSQCEADSSGLPHQRDRAQCPCGAEWAPTSLRRIVGDYLWGPWKCIY